MKCPSCDQENRQSAAFCDTCGARLATVLEDTSASTNVSNTIHGSSTFVGRQQELHQLQVALEDALSGRGRLVMLVGEPGIGKTRTVEELATYAQGCGARLLWGRCYEEQGMPPYWPWVQAIRPYVWEQDPQLLKSELGAGAADIAEVVSEVKEQLPDLKPATQPESPEQARFRLFDSITFFLKTISQKQPLLLVLDDLHWADQPSLLLLQFVTRELAGARILLLGTYRDVEVSRRHPLSQALGELTRERLFQRVLLRGWASEEVGRFIQLMSGISPPAGLVEQVHRQTEGNPFFVTEVVRLLVQEGVLTAERSRQWESWSLRVPEGVREVIGRRLDRLSERCNQTLTTAAVVGREFSLYQLKLLVADSSEDALLEVMEEALASGVLEELPGSATDYQFSHALIQETLTSELSAARRVRLHAQIAQVLEQLYSNDLEAHASQLAYHFTEAEPVLGTDKLVRYSLIAGEQALAAYAYEEALVHFQRALAAREGQPMDEQMADLLFGLGKAQAAFFEGERLPEAVTSLTRSFDYYAGAGDTEKAISVAEYPINPYPGVRTGIAHLLSQGLETVPTGSLLAGRLWSRLSRALMLEEGSIEAAQDALDRALEIARREKDVRLEAQTLANGAHAKYQQLRYSEALELSLRSLGLSSEADDLWSECLASYIAAQIHMDMGNPGQTQKTATAMLEPAGKLRSRYYLTGANSNLGHSYALCGNWDKARAFYDEALSHLPRDPRVLSRRAFMECQVGEFDRGNGLLEQLLDLMRSTAQEGSLVYALTALALVRVSSLERNDGRLELAEFTARAHLTAPSATPFTSTVAHAALGFLAVEKGHASAAQEQYSWMIGWSNARQNIWGIPTHRIMGLMSSTLGNLDQAAAHFEASLDYCRQSGYRPELAWTCHDYAGTLLQRNGPGDQEKARYLLDEALAISTGLGMRPLVERVQERLASLEPTADLATSYPNGLTQREVEVLRLVAQGKSNREIGEVLVISEGTARRHVSNIYDKTGVTNRAEATRYALEQKLVSSG